MERNNWTWPEALAAGLRLNASLPDFANIILLLSRGDPEAVLKALPEPAVENGAAVKEDALAALRAYLKQVVTCREAIEKGELGVGEEVFQQSDPEALRTARSALGDLFFAGAGSKERKMRELPKPFQSLANKGARSQEKGSNDDF